MLEATLKDLHFSSKEVRVYFALVQLGTAAASEIATHAQLPRQTTYSVLKILQKKGVIEQSDRHGVKQFVADPDALLQYTEQQRRGLGTIQRRLKTELPKVLAKQRHKPTYPRVQYYEERDGLKRLFQGILNLYRNGESKNFRGYGVNNLHEALGDFLFHFVKQRGEYKVNTKLFIGLGADDFGITGPENQFGRDIKRLDIPPAKAGVYLVKNRIYLFSYADNVGVMVENEAIVDLLKNIFDDHWKRA